MTNPPMRKKEKKMLIHPCKEPRKKERKREEEKEVRKKKKQKDCELPCGESNPGHGGESAGS